MQTNLLKPKAINVEQLAQNRAKVALEPFERGYGHTLGNAIRRVLLSSMVGYAATEVTIAGVLHEYSSIDGVQEDVVNILLNLKGVVFKLHNRDEVTLSLRKDGEGVVTAGDIQTPHDVEIVNPEDDVRFTESWTEYYKLKGREGVTLTYDERTVARPDPENRRHYRFQLQGPNAAAVQWRRQRA